MLVLTVGALSVGFAIASGIIQDLAGATLGASRHYQQSISSLTERITLIHWTDGTAIVSNDGKIPVRIVRLYVDGEMHNVAVLLQPGQNVRLSVGAGSSLLLETERGNLLKLKG